MTISELPRVSLACLPTPVMELKQLSAILKGPQLLMKRDDLNGLAFGGNKARKLEYLVGDAIASGCDTLVTGGAAQSNHCRQTAAAAAASGLACHLVLGGAEPAQYSGNLLLDHLLGAMVHWSGEFRKGEQIPEIAEQLRLQGKKPYVIPYGGSNAVGAVGFVEAMRELYQQLDAMGKAITHVVFASSSCGTQAGLAVGARLLSKEVNIVGIRIDKDESEAPFEEQLCKLTDATARRVGIHMRSSDSDFQVSNGYLGDGYGVIGALELQAISRLAKSEGILLDPVYTGRAMGALIDLIEKGQFARSDRVLFWHTGGTPALFSYADELVVRS